jgi:hypothetical protein
MTSLNSDDPFKIKHGELITNLEAHTIKQGAITLTEVAELKRLAEAILMTALSNRLRKRARREPNDELPEPHTQSGSDAPLGGNN